MESTLSRFLCGVSFVVLTTSASTFAGVEGTYVLEDSEDSRFRWKQLELTIKADDDGGYSAVLTESSGEVLLDSDEIEVDGQEFKAIFTLSSDLGDLIFTYAGQVENGKLTGSITESMFGTEVELVGKLKSQDDLPPPLQEESNNEFEIESETNDTSVSQSINPDIVGTYILDNESSSRIKPELTLNLDGIGKYSATLIAGKVTKTDDVEGENNKFSATFKVSTNIGDMDITYAGRIESDRLIGTITESLFGAAVKLVGKLKNEEEPEQDNDSE
ncbi:MAG: hypothetical protein F4227_07850 [Gammaproteobacteria bacterium]|nr:hypothetical protein [Gammaproteobacteria bacterium]MYF02865.1 hypothetical protein [Gammaproteobacteria bacterium]MYI77717.1 hypothetical protein [Gammaproteobacteria bacterium]